MDLEEKGSANIPSDTNVKVLFQYSFSRDIFQILVLDVGKSCIMASPVCAIKQTSVWLGGQAVKTSPFHGGNTGSIPVRVI